ncbi:PASTA domain-containing protein [Embleya sp. NPDC050154]|uniref:PASTA domain-containing protein n=1 Tax=unclassified Embleya TaxID=2699296 RepID=UPI0037B24FD0
MAGPSEEDARTRIQAAGLLPTFTRTKTPDSRNHGKALRTDPAGTSVTVLTAVTVHLGIPDIR